MLLYKYRPWNAFTIEVIRDKKIFFPSKQKLNDPAELVHPVRFENSLWDEAFERARAIISDQTFALADEVREKFNFLEAIRGAHPEVETSGEYSRFANITDRHWRSVEAVCDKVDVHQAIAYYFLNLAEDKIGIYDSDARLIQRLNARLESIGVLSLSSRSDCPVMWTHYAQNHQGVILVFDMDGEAMLPSAKPVDYVENRPENAVDSVVSNLYKKGKSWEYEHEYRILVNRGNASYSFTPGALTGVILGSHMTEQDRGEAFNLASSESGLTIFQAHPSASHYAVDHREIR
jgi:Protein of unknown function (DUF2971)